MSTPSTDAGSSRDPRDRAIVRAALLLGVLLLAFLVARGCGARGDVSSERAIDLARKEATFRPDREQVRLVQRGVPPRSFWAVSLYDVDARNRPSKIEVFLVDTMTGEIRRG